MTPTQEHLARRYSGYCERWCERMERRYGEDFAGDYPLILWRAVESYDPLRGTSFCRWLTHRLHLSTRGIVLRAQRRREKRRIWRFSELDNRRSAWR